MKLRFFRRLPSPIQALLVSLLLVFPFHIQSVVSPIHFSGSTGGNHFSVSSEAGTISLYGWKLETIFQSDWMFEFYRPDTQSAEEWGGILSLWGLDVFIQISPLNVLIPYWAVELVVWIFAFAPLLSVKMNSKRSV